MNINRISAPLLFFVSFFLSLSLAAMDSNKCGGGCSIVEAKVYSVEIIKKWARWLPAEWRQRCLPDDVSLDMLTCIDRCAPIIATWLTRKKDYFRNVFYEDADFTLENVLFSNSSRLNVSNTWNIYAALSILFEAIVSFNHHVLIPGNFVYEFGGSYHMRDESSFVFDKLSIDPVGRLYRWSNANQKEDFCEDEQQFFLQ